MQNKILVIFFAVVVMQLIYFLVKSTKDRRLNSSNTFLKGREYVRGYIAIVLLIILLVFLFI